MNLPNEIDDLKDYRDEDDPFVFFTPDQCVWLLCALIAVAAILWPYL